MEKKEKDAVKKEEQLPGYPPYPPNEDIYNQEKKVYREEGMEIIEDRPEPGIEQEDKFVDIDDERRGRLKMRDDDGWNEQGYVELETGEELDVPGAELDDDLEMIGEEDEENNYYSLGGDNHDDLDEREDVGK